MTKTRRLLAAALAVAMTGTLAAGLSPAPAGAAPPATAGADRVAAAPAQQAAAQAWRYRGTYWGYAACWAAGTWGFTQNQWDAPFQCRALVSFVYYDLYTNR
jgi:hypothetical protein